MKIEDVQITPFQDQRPGTSGLRKRTSTFQQPHYLAAYVQAVFDVAPPEGPLVLGGDGRYFNDEALQLIIRIALANGCPHLIIGQDGLLSTPAASHLIRSRKAVGGLILSASHNPGGPLGDFGIKFNTPNGAPAPEEVTRKIFERTQTLQGYRLAQVGPIDLRSPTDRQVEGVRIEIVPSAAAYGDLMERLFDFDQIADLVRSGGFGMAFDGMNAVTGPYAEEILHRRLGVPASDLMRCTPLPDFGGGHPDPNPDHARELVARLQRPEGPVFGAASDGDGDRHLILGRAFHVNPSDSLAILAANATLAPGYASGLAGVARSMPTSRAVDLVAQRLGVPCYETPTGWKFFGSLLDAGAITLCGEESAGAGSNHVREKDGLWAILFWLNIMAARKASVREIVEDHWRSFGRHACLRLDFEGLPTDAAETMMAKLAQALPSLPGKTFGERQVLAADSFNYVDPIDGSEARDQGLRVYLSGEGRIVFRLSGTGTSGATLRVYLEQYAQGTEAIAARSGALVRPLEAAALALCQVEAFTGKAEPTHRV